MSLKDAVASVPDGTMSRDQAASAPSEDVRAQAASLQTDISGKSITQRRIDRVQSAWLQLKPGTQSSQREQHKFVRKPASASFYIFWPHRGSKEMFARWQTRSKLRRTHLDGITRVRMMFGPSELARRLGTIEKTFSGIEVTLSPKSNRKNDDLPQSSSEYITNLFMDVVGLGIAELAWVIRSDEAVLILPCRLTFGTHVRPWGCVRTRFPRRPGTFGIHIKQKLSDEIHWVSASEETPTQVARAVSV
ncbi:hypothetical protein BDY19DRAFT_904032 [Irpex rosettiformis]|uniref:Uncharacterized protein n=1 Tax=Irpex rosettiformis TaxID=378272 RepID=A0ACB8UDP3_9APHY|nr:hypothetical protein BDY19DRAFT_904032 [Irpex rosettiformis]